MVRMLKERWTSLSPIIKKKYEPAPKPSIESCCAICMEEMTFFEWSEYDGDYIEKTKITYCDSDKSGYNPILTKCGHVFCNACLKTMIHMNYEYNETVGRRDSLHVYADFPMKDFKSQVFHKSEFQVNSDDVKNHLTRFHAFKCPMCRSHDIKNPVARDIELTVYENGDKLPKTHGSDWMLTNMTPKERRHYLRKSGPYESPFSQNTNRIRREISTGTGRSSILMPETFHRGGWQNDINWISNVQVVNEYNGRVNVDLRDYILEN